MFWMFDALRKLRYAHCVIPQGWIALLISLDLHRKRLFNANEKHYAHCRTMSAQTSEDKKGATEKHAFADWWWKLYMLLVEIAGQRGGAVTGAAQTATARPTPAAPERAT